jgi:hypothetical protein
MRKNAKEIIGLYPVFGRFWPANGFFVLIWAKNCANSAKKLLPLVTLTIIMFGLVMKINGCQS